MASKNKNVLTASPIVRKTFTYEYGNVNMGMTLRIDQKAELESAMSIVERFLEDLRTELKRINDLMENRTK